MEKNIILSVNESNKVLVNDNFVKAIARITKGFGMPLEWLRKYYSQVMEKEITKKQTMLLDHMNQYHLNQFLIAII